MSDYFASNFNPPQLLNECRNCKMRFDNAQALANHVKKFCSDSSYADVGKLEQRLQELGQKPFDQNLNFNFQDVILSESIIIIQVKQYMKGETGPVNTNANQAIGKMNLEDLRNYFQSENRKYEDITKQAVRAKEQELIDELQDIKKERNFLRQQRQEQDMAMHDLIKELELKKERELRARIEKEEIQRNLKEIEKTKTSALERDKRRELERLAAERENLRLREEEILDDIKKLEIKHQEQEYQLKQEKDRKLNQVNNSEYYGQVMRRKEVEIAKQRGEEIAILQQKKDNLERDRQKIMDDLDKVKVGDMSGLRRNEASRWAANDIIQRGGIPSSGIDITRVKLDPAVKDKLVTDQVRINQLREEREKMLREALPELDELDAMTKLWTNGNQNQINRNNPVNKNSTIIQPYQPDQFTQANRNQFLQDFQPAGPISKSPQRNLQNNIPKQLSNPQDDEMLEKLRLLREEYAREGEGDPQFFAQLDDLENHLLGKNKVKTPQIQKQQPRPVSSQIKPQNLPQQQQFIPPPFLNPGLFPPSLNFNNGPFPQAPFNFYPPPLFQTPAYIPPPPPQLNGDHGIERYQQHQQENGYGFGSNQYAEPPPQMVQPYLNPQIEAINKVIQEQEIQNQILEKELQNLKMGQGSFENFEAILGGTDNELSKIKNGLGVSKLKGRSKKDTLPEDFVFRQNEFRCEDLEVEERALMNLAAQEFDALRVLSKIPQNSDLYRYKMDQYKELSTMRAEVEKVLQEQKLEKIRRDFEKQKFEDERKFKHEKWLEDQKRQILEAKLKNVARKPPPKPFTPQQSNPQLNAQESFQTFEPPRLQSANPSNKQNEEQRQATQRSIPQNPPPLMETAQSFFKQSSPKMNFEEANPNQYDPEKGFNLFFDFIAKLQRQFRSMRIVYAIYNVSRSIIPPTLVDIHDGEPDPEDRDKNRIVYKDQNLIKNVQPHPSANLIIEFQVPKPNAPLDKFVSYGWTVLNLFDVYYELNRGIFKLPIYVSPTKTDIDIRDIPILKKIPESVLCMRIGNPDDENSKFQVVFHTSPQDYLTPQIHQREEDNQQKPQEEEKIQRKTGLQNLDASQKPQKDQNLLDIPDMPNEERIRSSYECKGVNVQLHFLRQYIPPTHLRVQCTLYDGTNIVKTDDQKLCNWASKSIDSQNLLMTRNENPVSVGLSYNQNGVPRGEILNIDDETTWIKDLYQLQNDKNRINDINLVFQLMEYSSGRNFNQQNEIKQDYSPIAYGVLKLNNPDATIRYGTYDVDFYKLPVNLTRRNQVDLLKYSMKVTIAQPPFLPSRPQLPSQIKDQQKEPPLQKPQIQVEPEQFPKQQQPPNNKQNLDRPFIPNDLKQYDEKLFLEGQGVDFYVDGARFIPENTTYSRVIVRGYTMDQYRVINATKGMADLDVSKGRAPFFGFRQEIRAPKIDPTLTMLISIETIDRVDGAEKIVGYAYFPLFLNAQNKTPVNNRNQTQVILQNGSYQIPIFHNKIPVDKDITIENIQSLEKIPCASVLVRCYRAAMENNRVLSIQDVNFEQWRTKGLIVDPPEYSDGVYNTSYCFVNQFEKELFDLKSQRSNPPMRQVIEYVKQMKARVQQMPDEQLITWLDKQLITNPQTQSINLKYFSSYEPKFGFKFSVERLHGLILKQPYIVVTSITPPGSLYKQPPQRTQDVSFFVDYNWEGPWNSLQFYEDYINYVGLAPNRKLGLVIDVKTLKAAGEFIQLQDVGWAYLPIFDTLENENGSVSVYTNSGLYSLALFQGPVQADLLQQAAQNPNPLNMLSKHPNLKLLNFASVIVRLHDNQREWVPPKGYYGDLSNSLLPQEQAARFAFTEQRERPGGIEQAKKFIPGEVSKDEYKQGIQTIIDQKYRF